MTAIATFVGWAVMGAGTTWLLLELAYWLFARVSGIACKVNRYFRMLNQVALVRVRLDPSEDWTADEWTDAVMDVAHQVEVRREARA